MVVLGAHRRHRRVPVVHGDEQREQQHEEQRRRQVEGVGASRASSTSPRFTSTRTPKSPARPSRLPARFAKAIEMAALTTT
jgi:hypothetical protein